MQTRIAQFKQMADADPDNELGHLSLAKAYIDAGQHTNAIPPLRRVLELNATLSKAYQLLGAAQRETGNHEEAVKVLTQGVTVADERGDRMPRDAMAGMLKELGADVPVPNEKPAPPTERDTTGASTPGFQCCRCSRPTGQLTRPPFKGALGDKIHAHVCQTCWHEWVPMGTKVINECGLALADPAAQAIYDQYMTEFLQLDNV
ncbi:MAG: Fe(2+)-trafficking protein [Phycisphaerae bacterium]